MDSQPCRVVLTGELVAGYTREAVIAAVARLFQTSAGGLIELFDGRPHAVDEALSADDAMALQRQLEAMGAHARVEMEQGEAPVFTGLRRPVDDVEYAAGIMHCPACGHRQLVSTHCDECGIAFADFAARTMTPAPPASPAVTRADRRAAPPASRPPPAPRSTQRRPPPPARDIHSRDAANWADAWVDDGNELPSEEFHLSLFMGLHGARLLGACKRMKVGPRTLPALSWNGAAVVSPFLWTMYRKMWALSVVVFFADILLPVLFIALGSQQYISDKFAYLGFAALIGNRLFWPFVVDYLYCRHARGMVRYLNRMSPTYASDIDIATAGGTSKTAVFVGVVLASALSLLSWNIVQSVHGSVMKPKVSYAEPAAADTAGSGNTGAANQELSDDAKWIMTRSNMRSIARRTAGWLNTRPEEVDPETLTMGAIRNALALDANSLRDRWDRQIRYSYMEGAFDLISAGADGAFDTGDDIRVRTKLEP